MNVKAVLFDMDGTVLDTLDDLADSVNRSLAQFSLPPVNRDRVRAALGNGAARLIRACLPQEADEALAERVLAWYKPYYEAHCRIKTGPYPGILSLMERLKAAGAKLAVISNKPDPAVQELAESFFPGLLTVAVGERPGIPRKPDPAAVLEALRVLGEERENAVYIGDTEVDLLTAQNAGLDCLAVTWGFRDESQLLAAGATRLAHNTQDLAALLGL